MTGASIANAGCGEVATKPAAFVGGRTQSFLVRAAYQPGRFALVSDDDRGGDKVVGLWSVKLTSLGNLATAGIPDGATLDWGYAQWHSDGTEIMNSGGRAPATGNFCLGVWAKTGPSSYKLNHVALSYDAVTGLLNGTVKLHEVIKLDNSGNHFSGTVTFDIFAPNGPQVGHLTGTITGDRITADQ